MARTLVIGCSFVSSLLHRFRTGTPINHAHYHILGSPGSGNQAISTRAIYQLSQEDYERVIVLWSGVNRLDFPVSDELQRTQHNNPDNKWVASCNIGRAAWYHSGGFLGTGVFGSIPEPVQIFLRAQYLGSDPDSAYLSELTLMSIVNLQNALKARSIDSQMAFIYNTKHGDVGRHQEHSHGRLNLDSEWNRLVDWNQFHMSSNPYDWARHQDLLEPDNYHPTRNAMIEWFKEHMSVDMTQ
jgi:hypothetical protein